MLYKVFGAKGIEKGMNYFMTTNWSGEKPIQIFFQKNPNKKVIEEIKDFLLNELDSHDDYDKFCKVIKIMKNRNGVKENALQR